MCSTSSAKYALQEKDISVSFQKGFNLSYLDGVSLIISNGIYEGEDILLNHITKCFPRLLIL